MGNDEMGVRKHEDDDEETTFVGLEG